jgi:hypothetical protein
VIDMSTDPIDRLARAYFKVLSATDWAEPLVVAGLREGLNKFLSNAHLALYFGENKYHKTHFVSLGALDQLERRIHKDLVWEHLVPKAVYLQRPCERRAAEQTLTVEFIADLLRKYWQLATVTKIEERLLERRRMPATWDTENLRARYEAVGIQLVPNPFFRSRLPGPSHSAAQQAFPAGGGRHDHEAPQLKTRTLA